MRLVVADPDPSSLPITWEDADQHCRLDGDTDLQPQVEGMIAAAIGTIDGSQGWLGRNLTQRQVDAYRADFDDLGPYITLPLGPVASVTLVEYRDPATGAWTAVDPSLYELQGDVLVPAWRQHWPRPALAREAVHIRYVAGYENLPKPIRSALLLMIDDLYENRESTVDARASAAVAVPMSTTVENLLNPFRLYV